MRSQQITWNAQAGWSPVKAELGKASLVFYFGTRQMLACGKRYNELREMFPSAHILGCSTGRGISTAAISAMMKSSPRRSALMPPGCAWSARTSATRSNPAVAARRSGARSAGDLAGIFVLSDGLNVNGSELVGGVTSVVGGDPADRRTGRRQRDFEETLVGADCAPRPRQVAAIGFYGAAIRIGHGSAGGWDEFGPRRRITRSSGNVLHELDGEPALDLYERYLGEDDAAACPARRCCFRC